MQIMIPVSLRATAMFHRPRCRGASAMEYLMVLALVVIPLALLAPGIQHMIALYTQRILNIVALPFG